MRADHDESARSGAGDSEAGHCRQRDREHVSGCGGLMACVKWRRVVRIAVSAGLTRASGAKIRERGIIKIKKRIAK